MAFGPCHFPKQRSLHLFNKKSFVPKGMGIPLLFIFVWNAIVYCGSRFINTYFPHYNMTLPADGLIPLVPWMVSVYVLSYPFWFINYILGTRGSKEDGFRFLSAEFAAKTVCLLCFLLIPTICVRPELSGGGFWNWLLGLIYAVDTPDNLFPSVHCLAGWLSFIAVRNNPTVPKWYRWFSLAFAIAICASVVMTKQHVLVDIPSGVILAELSYWLVERTGFSKVFQSVFEKVLERKRGSSC